MKEIKLTITVQKPSGYTSTKTVVVSEEVFNEVENIINPSRIGGTKK
jgi:hypothetical protein